MKIQLLRVTCYVTSETKCSVFPAFNAKNVVCAATLPQSSNLLAEPSNEAWQYAPKAQNVWRVICSRCRELWGDASLSNYARSMTKRKNLKLPMQPQGMMRKSVRRLPRSSFPGRYRYSSNHRSHHPAIWTNQKFLNGVTRRGQCKSLSIPANR